MRSILLLPLVARCLETMDVCICFFVCCSDYVEVCGNVCCVAAIVKNSVCFSLGVLNVCVIDVVFSVVL